MSRSAARGAIGPALVAFVSTGAVAAAPFLDGPPPAVTGGFGEPSCRQCHFDESAPDRDGALVIEGFPEHYAPGRRYRITARVHRPGMRSAGVELAVRFANGPRRGEQAGTLEPADARTAVTPYDGIDYAHHTEAGAALDGPDTATWTVAWTAPAGHAGRVALHAAANAANGDESPFGDRIYTGADSAAAREPASGREHRRP